ncbi:MAG: hypothetical protein RJB59_518, partial [Actinomycetota bacterium]
RRLARAVAADDGGDLPGLDPQRDALQREDAAIGGLQIPHLKQGVIKFKWLSTHLWFYPRVI